jgi:Mg-chelatase subunit ChlD
VTSSVSDTLDSLAGSRQPYLIGVRHHSPALAVAMPDLLDAAQPEVLLIELPQELGEWLPWLADDRTVAPVALSGAAKDGGSLAFYPFADFSPELAAIRWASRNDVPVRPCDLPLACRGGYSRGPSGPTPLTDALRRGITGRDSEDLWDRLVEAPAPGQSAESVRRAALMVGWAMRQDSAEVDPHDLRREAWMRRCVSQAGASRVTAVVGSFHASALLSGDSAEFETAEPQEIVTSLVPYTFDLLDSRSGYPAGIRDPEWQQAVLSASGDPVAIERITAELTVRVCAGLRTRGHPAGPAEAREVLRLAVDLARLRGLPAPGRGELIESIQTVLTHGEPVGRGRMVARAVKEVLIGNRSGSLAPGTPRSGLAPAVEAEFAELRLPGPDQHGKNVRLRLDPMRSPLDSRRQVALQRLDVLGIPYGRRVETEGIGAADALTTQWSVTWTPSTAATLPVAGIWGVTLEQAAEGRLRSFRAQEATEGGSTAVQVIRGLKAATECVLVTLTGDRLADAAAVLPASGTLRDLLTGLDLLDRLRAGHLPVSPALLDRHPELAGDLETAAVSQIEGMAGSDDTADARAIVELGQRHSSHGTGLRLSATLRDLALDGSPLMQGAAAATRVLLELDTPADLGARATSWVDTATTREARTKLGRRLAGVLTAASALLETPEALAPLMDRMESLPDKDFLDRLPALRGGFREVGPAARDRILQTVEERTGLRLDLALNVDPVVLARWVLADRAGEAAVEASGLGLPPEVASSSIVEPVVPAVPDGSLPPIIRWQLILGKRGDRPAGGARYAAALDELYGSEGGEGAAADTNRRRGGSEQPFPDVREWSEELQALFGKDIREEVLAAAAEGGRLDAALELDPDSVRPSIDLLRNVLALAGGLPESALARLRPLVARMVEELTRQLATQMRPALTGLQLPRPSRRPGGRLDLNRTLRENLASARRRPDGTVLVIPERPIFRTRSRRANDWRLILVVDVSASMEASTIWSAITASILAGVPMLTTHFLTFSTEVIDLTDRVSDPLSLLLEVKVGGGTYIAGGLRHARSLVTVPERTMVVVISDFEEGAPLAGLLAETRELVASGVKVLGCASLDDTGTARYSVGIARSLVAAGMPVAALSPQQLAKWVGDQIR